MNKILIFTAMCLLPICLTIGLVNTFMNSECEFQESSLKQEENTIVKYGNITMIRNNTITLEWEETQTVFVWSDEYQNLKEVKK